MCLGVAVGLNAQCTNWQPVASVTSASSCAASGTFTVRTTGPDSANLTNLQYTIPPTNGFSVPLNSSPNFTSIPAGTFSVSVTATCAGGSISKTTTVTMPGNYAVPQATLNVFRASADCPGSLGILSLDISGGRPPYMVSIVAAPPSFTGPRTIRTNGGIVINDATSGNYTVQVTDACGTGTVPQSVYITPLNFNDIDLAFSGWISTAHCDTLMTQCPGILPGNAWMGYNYSPILQVTMQISGLPSTLTASMPLSGSAVVSFKLPAGMTIKDCYGRSILYTLKDTCSGRIKSFSTLIPAPNITSNATQNCNISFDASLATTGPLCPPVTYRLTDLQSGRQYGPYTGSTIPSLPIGAYSITGTTSDGYVMNSAIGTSPLPADPYTITALPGLPGLENYIEGFRVTASFVPRNCSVDLFSGPPGYTFHASMSGSRGISFSQNATPVLPNTLLFGPGNYVWKITDDCGVHFLPITIGAQSLYQFSIGMVRTRRTCDGLWVWPNATMRHDGRSSPARFAFLREGRYVFNPVRSDQLYENGDSVLLTVPGHYDIVATGASYTVLQSMVLPIPGPYMNSYGIDYTADPARVDINATQGFLCIGAQAGEGQIFASGAGGIPFSRPVPHYSYYLARAGSGSVGPYFQQNTSGVFMGFNANADDLYDVKVVDSCGASAVQQVRILNLLKVHAIGSSSYLACEQDTLRLSALYLPDATYAWTGPNGFVSSAQSPVIPSVGAAAAGVYYVTVVSPACGEPLHDSAVVTVHNAPPKPLISLRCSALLGGYLKMESPVAPTAYQWEYAGTQPSGVYRRVLSLSDIRDTALIRFVYGPGSWRGVAIDTATGCRSYSDSVYFPGDPSAAVHAEISVSRTSLCPGDTLILFAQGAATPLNYQWFRNGAPIAGAHSATLPITQPGTYRVWIDGGYCRADTSAERLISPGNLPLGRLTAAQRVACEGDTVLLQAPSGTGFIYTWQRNGATIRGAASAVLPATRSGVYRVTAMSDGCARASDTLTLTFFPAPVVNLVPAMAQTLCPGEQIPFSTTASPGYAYTWYRNDTVIGNAAAAGYPVSQPGIYRVSVTSFACPARRSAAVPVTALPGRVNLGNDTVVCLPGAFSIPLAVPDGYTQIRWQDGQSGQAITAHTSGVYWVEAINRCGTFSDTLHIRSLADFAPGLPAEKLICNFANSEVVRVPALLAHIRWSTGDTAHTIRITRPGTYWVEGESPCGMLQDTMKVSFCAPRINAITLPLDTLCEGDCIALSATVDNYPQNYRWVLPGADPDSASDEAPRRVCYPRQGIYPITLYVLNAGGADSFTTWITVMPHPAPRFRDTAFQLSYKKSIVLPACAEAAAVSWYKDDSLICSNCPSIEVEGLMYRSVYHCVVRNGPCADSCIYRMQVIDIPHDVWLPDAFTPNGDGRNDVFRIITDNPNVYGIELSLYNRWGQKIYVSHSRSDGWNGRLNGGDADAGTYFFTLTYKVLGSDETYRRKGDLVLIR